MFNFIKDKLNKIYSNFTEKLSGLFIKKTIDKETLLELESLLFSSDIGVKTTKEIIKRINDGFQKGELKEGKDLKLVLEKILIDLLSSAKLEIGNVILLVGINGSGKTTFAGKLAHHFKNQNKKVLMIAGDTFRAAATEQLNQWAQKTNCDILIGQDGQDPASVIFDGCDKFKKDKYDVLIIDTAGRLQTKINLMKELQKIKKVIEKQLPESKISTFLTVDSMLGQNSLEQAKIFNESTNLDGLVLTKMDGTGKAGVVFAIVNELKVPIAFICFGEEVDKMKDFNPQEFVSHIL